MKKQIVRPGAPVWAEPGGGGGDLAKSNLLCLMEQLEKRTRWSALPGLLEFVKATRVLRCDRIECRMHRPRICDTLRVL